MSMTPERWQQIKVVLRDVLELTPQQRSEFLAEACSDDPALRQEVESFLALDDEKILTGVVESSAGRVPLPPGTRLGEYEVQSLLGVGGMGEVYRARDPRLRRDVAIKVLPSLVSDDPDRLQRFEQEARAAASLNHPNILAIFQMGTYEGAPYLVSELLDGGTLREQLLRGPMPVRRAIDYSVQIARGLAAAHEKGVVHRDLKPENLFITNEGRAKILDFGLAKLTQPYRALDGSIATATEGTEPGVVMGTVGYMSPEQVQGKAADHRADIFAFGTILYELLTGKRAFRKATSPETMSAIINEEPPGISEITPNVPLALQRVVFRCLEKKPEQRFQSASDLAFALEALSDSGALSPGVVGKPSNLVRSRSLLLVGASLVLLLAVVIIFSLRSTNIPIDPSTWVQVTSFPDSVTQPALSPDGRMLTFVRGPYTFAGPGQIYVKMLPDGEPAKLTQENSQKMSPAFSPDGSRIAYTNVDSNVHWDTWVLPVLGGQPRLWLPNASGLVWSGRKILFSEIKDNNLQMGIVTADEGRAEQHDVYLPLSDRGMAHRTFPSPNGKWALVIEMDRALWLPCKLISLDSNTPPRPVGPAGGPCTAAAWSPDGKWMYFTSSSSGAFHIWRQRFPRGRPEQITSGPTEEEGIAVAPDGLSLITAVGSRQSSVWVRDLSGKRQVSLEGFSYDPTFTPDGKRLCYRVLKGTFATSETSELRLVDLESGHVETLLPGFAIVGLPHRTYDISPDNSRVVVTALDHEGKRRLWLTSFDRRLPPHQVPNIEGDNPLFGPAGELFFRGVEGNAPFVYRVREDGTGLKKIIDQRVGMLDSTSPDGRWLAVKLTPEVKGSSTAVISLREGASVRPITSGSFNLNDIAVRWSVDMRSIYITLQVTEEPGAVMKAYEIPLPRGRSLPEIPATGLQSEEEIAKLPGARLLDEFDSPGITPGMYAFVRMAVERNLFRIPLPH